ncbi:MAG: hypothetical protein OHK0012_15620 [Synechococcales cyanobacterium]
MRALLITTLLLAWASGIPVAAQSLFDEAPETRVKLLGVKPYRYQGETYRLDGLGIESQGRRYLMCVSQLYEVTEDDEIILMSSKVAQPCPGGIPN